MGTTADLHTLTGVYAMNALSGEERAEFEAHLPRCSSCAQEIAEFQATAATLGIAAESAPPAHLRGRVLLEVGATRQLPPETPQVAASARVVPLPNRWLMRASVLAAAASVLVAVVVGVQSAQDRSELGELRQSAAGYSQVSELLNAPDVKVLNGSGAKGGDGTVVMSPSHDKAVFLAYGLPSLPADRAYQLWAVGPDGPRSVSLVRDEPVVASGLADVRSLALTVEPSSGSTAPTTDAVLAISMA